MSRRSALLTITAIAAVTAPPASAAAPPPILGPADGVQATRSGKLLSVRFTGDSAKRAGVVGHDVFGLCAPHPGPGELAFSDDDASTTTEGGTVAADGTVALTLDHDIPIDACDLTELSSGATVARIALTPAGEAWDDESIRATALHALLTRAHGTGGYRPLTDLGPGLVALDGPEAIPAPGTTGYWTDGVRAAVATLSAAGRRLVIQDRGHGVLRTNVLEQSDPLSLLADELVDSFAASGAIGKAKERDPEDDGSPSPFHGTSPLLPRDGVRGAGGTGRHVSVRFTGRSAKTVRALAGRRVMTLCAARPALAPYPPRMSSVALRTAWTRVARHGGVVRFTLARPVDLCFLTDDGTSFATVPVSATGRRWLQDIDAVKLLANDEGDDSDRFAPSGATAYWPTATILAHGRKALTALPSPGAPVPLGRVGVWSDGARQAVEASTSATGRRFFLADEGDGMVRTNVFGELNLWVLLLTDPES